jgi:hypothetical protein
MEQPTEAKKQPVCFLVIGMAGTILDEAFFFLSYTLQEAGKPPWFSGSCRIWR